MKRLFAGALCALLIGAVSVSAEPGKKDKGGPPARAQATRQDDAHIHFSLEHIRAMRGHYAPRYRSLPPGLQKKYARTGQLPPGWQKKMEPLPVAIERSLPPLPAGYGRGVIDGHAVIYSSRGGTIIDVAVLF